MGISHFFTNIVLYYVLGKNVHHYFVLNFLSIKRFSSVSFFVLFFTPKLQNLVLFASKASVPITIVFSFI